MIDFLNKQYRYDFVGRGSEYRCKQHPSLAVKTDRRSWFWHSKGVGGYGVFDYLMKVETASFREAVETVTGVNVAAVRPYLKTEQPKTLFLPERAGVPLRLYDYLCNKRGIDGGIVNTLIQEGKIYEDRRGNVVFVGFDEQGVARFASLRGTSGDSKFRMDCAGSDKRYGFTMPACTPTERLYIFESAIDAMSHSSIENAVTGDRDAWQNRSRLSLGGTSHIAMPKYLEMYPHTYELVLCLDSDPPGRAAAVAIAEKYKDLGYKTCIVSPRGKDFNDDLLSLRAARRNHVKGEPCL